MSKLTERQKQEMKVPESTQQFRVTKWLDEHKFIYFAVPNGYKKSRYQQLQAKREGLKAGVPDIIILTKTPTTGQPVALEMKKYMGPKHAMPCKCMSKEQKEWMQKVVQNDFAHVLAHGSDDAIGRLKKLYNIA